VILPSRKSSPHVLAELGGLAAVVERVVDELKGNAEIHPDERQADCSSLERAPSAGPDLAGSGEQFGGLAADHREVFVLGGGGVLGGGERITSPSAMTAAAEERISSERSDPTSTIILKAWRVGNRRPGRSPRYPEHAGGELAAAHLALVDDVVVQQRRGVHEFDRGGELDVAVAGIAREPRHRQREHGPQPLTARGDQVVGDFGIIVTSDPVRDRIVALTRPKSGADQLDEPPDRGRGRTFKRDDDGQPNAPERRDEST